MKTYNISGRLFLAVGRVVLCLTLLVASVHDRLMAQDNEPSKLAVFDDYASYNIVTSATAPQNDFVLGWNWGDSPTRDLSTAMSINLWHGDGGKFSSWDFVRLKATENMKMVWALNHGLDPAISGDINQRCALQGQAVHLDPTISISTTGIFSIPSGNTQAGAFGFTNKGLGTTEQVNGIFHYVVRTTDITSPATTALVLSRPWPDNQLYRNTSINEAVTLCPDCEVYDGRQWYLSINLRRLGTANGNLQSNDPVLRIRVPYTTSTVSLQTNPAYIVFSQASPNSTSYSAITTSLYEDRGYSIEPTSVAGTTEFIITRNMLPRIVANQSTNITLSVYFETDGSPNLNLRTEGDWSDGTPTIKRLGVEVTYLGREDVAIQWIRFETPKARDLFRGQSDRDIWDAIDSDLNNLTNPDFGDANPMHAYIYRFYAMDELRTQLFWSLRYFNKLVGGIATTERGATFDTHYKQIVGSKEFWSGSIPLEADVAVPFIKRGNRGGDGLPYLGYKQGYDITSDHVLRPSQYETDGSSSAYQRKVDAKVIDAYHHATDPKGFQEPYSYFYTDTWWANMWITSEWHSTKIGSTFFPSVSYRRPFTGEEIRAASWWSLLLGAKGLVYHRATGHPMSKFYNPLDPSSSPYAYVSPTSYTSSTLSIQPGQTHLQFLQQDAFGMDFLQYSPTTAPVDDSELDEYIDEIGTAANLQIPPDRIYLGRKSMRTEIKRINDWVRSTEGTLMALQLQAWFGKGFTEVTSGNYSLLQNYVQIKETVGSTINTTTVRPPERIKSGLPDYEQQDSTFYDITLLKHKDKTLDNEFFIGVMNRRSDPVVVVPTTATFTINGQTVNGSPYGTSASLPAGKEFRFFTTAEFDALSTTATPVPSGKLGMYAQFGAREISVKFNYKTTDADYQLLRVQELGGGIDTVVGEDSWFRVLYKPGEGKLFRVTPLPVKSKPTGELAYSNQRKIVAYPKQGSTNELYYHMVYHSTKLGLTSVYYRRSKLVTTGTLSENIEWQAEKKLTVTTASGVSCGYPSLVVRNNSAGTPTVYVVYACTGNTIPAGNVLIAEHAFDAEASYSSLGTGTGLYLAKGDNLADWGTPVVSAGARGNYYAWADRDAGIGVGYKSTSATTFSAVNFVSWATTGTKNCQHPALNTYSRIAWDENEAALVWQEEGHIYYARLYDGTSGTLRLRTIISSAIVRNPALTIARLSDESCATGNKLPVVYRSIETTYRSPYAYGYFDVLLDRVFWQGTGPTGRKIICARKIDCSDLVSPYWGRVPRQMHFGALSSIFSSLSPYVYPARLEQPDVAQGSLVWGGFYNQSDSAVTLNCVAYLDVANEYSIWHVPLHYWTTLVNGSNALSDLRNSSWMPDRGRRVHLSAKPSFDNIGSWHLNRRIIENASSQVITTSARRFYRSTRDAEAITPLPGFSKSCAKYYVLEPYVDETEVFWKVEKPTMVMNSIDTMVWTRFDTLFTNWFTIGSSADISFYGMGSDTSFVQLELVKQSDGSRQTVAVAPATDTTAKLITRTVVSGGGNLYRLELRKKHVDAAFVEDILLGQLPVDNGGGIVPARRGAGGAEQAPVINLASGSQQVGMYATVFPNPAREKVFISAYRNYQQDAKPEYRAKLTVTVVNALGDVVYHSAALPGEVLELSTDALPSGAYFVRVGEAGVTGEQVYGTTSFVVER